ncbi:MAG: hypothetical protein ACQEQF_01775 [Bacillota bacterium]
MKIKIVDGKAQYLAKHYCYLNKPTVINENYINEIEEAIERGVVIEVWDGKKYINAEDYFEQEEEKDIEENETEEDDLESLKLKAKELGVDNYWVMNKDTLKEKITEIE